MLLTIRTTYQPATDLGFLLLKHPEHVHTREFPFGNATVFYPEFTDHAISGATLLRSGFQALMRDALNRRFKIVLAESLDRFSRGRSTPIVDACSGTACKFLQADISTFFRPRSLRALTRMLKVDSNQQSSD